MFRMMRNFRMAMVDVFGGLRTDIARYLTKAKRVGVRNERVRDGRT